MAADGGRRAADGVVVWRDETAGGRGGSSRGGIRGVGGVKVAVVPGGVKTVILTPARYTNEATCGVK